LNSGEKVRRLLADLADFSGFKVRLPIFMDSS
jgi:hypothetical protein